MTQIMMDNCPSSMAPSDEELVRYALDEDPLPIGAAGHLEHCSICQQRLTSYKQTNDFLLVQLYRHSCPSATLLNHYCADLLADDETMHTAWHIQDCPLCRAEVADIRHVLNNFDPFPEPEESPVRRFVHRIIATLIPLQPQLVMRGMSALPAQTVWPRQYRAGDINASIHLSRGAMGYIILGLFSSDHERLEGAPVILRSIKEKFETRTHIDDIEYISFRDVPLGEYEMVVCMPSMDIVMEGLRIAND